MDISSLRQFYDLLSGLNDADLKKAFGGTAKSQNGDIVTVDDLIDRATFRYAGPGEYIVEFKGLGTPYIENAEGEIVRTSGKFSVNAIMGGR